MDKHEDTRLSCWTADLLSLADVERWTTVRTLRPQSVAEHSWGVCVIVIELASRLGMSDVLGGALLWAIAHDMPETLTGDIDGRFKRMYPELSEGIKDAECAVFENYAKVEDAVSVPVRCLVKVADQIEGIAFIWNWKLGIEAESIYQELRQILFAKGVPALVVALKESVTYSNVGESDVFEAVKTTLNRIIAGTHTFRMQNRWVVK